MTGPAALAKTTPRAPWWRRWQRNALAMLAVAALAFWPCAGHYTSFGFDFEELRGDVVRCTFWRLRWPGDGSVMLGRIVEHRELLAHAVQPFDLGGAFLEPARPITPRGRWQECGFWWIDVGPGRNAPELVPGSDSAWLAGVPHWLLVLVLLAGAAHCHLALRRTS